MDKIFINVKCSQSNHLPYSWSVVTICVWLPVCNLCHWLTRSWRKKVFWYAWLYQGRDFNFNQLHPAAVLEVKSISLGFGCSDIFLSLIDIQGMSSRASGTIFGKCHNCFYRIIYKYTIYDWSRDQLSFRMYYKPQSLRLSSVSMMSKYSNMCYRLAGSQLLYINHSTMCDCELLTLYSTIQT